MQARQDDRWYPLAGMRHSPPPAYDLPTKRMSLWQRLTRRIRMRLLRILDQALMLLPGPRRRNGLAVILPHGLGDWVLFAAAYRDLCSHFPDQPVTVVCMPAAAPFVAYYLRPAAIITADRAGMINRSAYRIGVLRRMTNAGVRVAVQPGANRSLMIEDALIRHSRAEERSGSRGSQMFISSRERQLGDGWYTRLLPEQPDELHESMRAAAFVSALTGRATPAAIIRLAAPDRPPLAPSRPYLVACCETSSPLKTWPFERFMDVARQISARTGMTIVLAGSATGTRVAGALDLRGQTDFPGLLALLAHARFILSAESAPSILAAALGVPSVVVGGAGMPGRYLPFPPDVLPDTRSALVVAARLPDCAGCGYGCRYVLPPGSPAPCITDVETGRVLTAAFDALS